MTNREKSDASTAPAPSRSRCLFCRSTRCDFRIRTDDGEFDEVACRDHHKELEAHADATLGHARQRWHQSSSGRVRRAKPREETHDESR